MKIHIVQKGDTLWKIAKKYGVDFEELKKMNAQLSNPEMIMPGMKIKVPTTGGSIKKETVNYKKEMPKAVNPYAEQIPPTLPVQKEIIKEVPKEVIKEVPKEVPVKEKVYIPQMPQTIVPEIDINNYYTMNMSQMQAQVQAPPPMPVQKEKEVESVESESSVYMPQMPIMPVQEECYETMYPTNYCPPPMMPVVSDCGCGGGMQFPYQYGYQVPMTPYQMPQTQGAMYQQPYTGMPQMQGTFTATSMMPEQGHWMQGDDDESSSLPMMPYSNMGTSQNQFQGMPYMQGQEMHQQGNPYMMGQEGQHQGMPYMQGQEMQHQGMPYMQGQEMQHQGMPYMQGQEMQPQAMPYMQGQEMQQQGMPYMQGQQAQFPSTDMMQNMQAPYAPPQGVEMRPDYHWSHGDHDGHHSYGHDYNHYYNHYGHHHGAPFYGGYPFGHHPYGGFQQGYPYGGFQQGYPYGSFNPGAQHSPFGYGFPSYHGGYPFPREEEECDDC